MHYIDALYRKGHSRISLCVSANDNIFLHSPLGTNNDTNCLGALRMPRRAGQSGIRTRKGVYSQLCICRKDALRFSCSRNLWYTTAHTTQRITQDGIVCSGPHHTNHHHLLNNGAIVKLSLPDNENKWADNTTISRMSKLATVAECCGSILDTHIK